MSEDKKLHENLAAVREAIDTAAKKAGRMPEEITLVAVSKLHPVESIQALIHTGQMDYGENYVQEWQGKNEALEDIPVRWHYIGGLQSNKAKYIAGQVALIHSVDSLKLAQAIHKKAESLDTVQNILLQVSLAGEEQKSGITPDKLQELTEEVLELDNIRLMGLMTMPPLFNDPEGARPYFAQLRGLQEKLETSLDLVLPHLSMGMTGDFISAIEEGATLVRVGTRIFGTRPA